MIYSTAPSNRRHNGLLWVVLFAVAGSFFLSPDAQGQDLPPQRQIRTYIPPEQIVNFLPTTPLNQFLESVNPIFLQALGKRVIDPENRANPIGISVIGMYFFDAFEVVLEIQGLSYRETEQYFIIEEAPPEQSMFIDETGAAPAAVTEELATLSSREIQIEAVLFEANLTKIREVGIDWGTIFGTQVQIRVEAEGTTRPRFFAKTSDLFEPLDEYLLSPDLVDLAFINRMFRLLETEGIGETIANPSIAVQSGQEGRIQIGSDIPLQTRDFAGNTLTQFAQTGIIIEVTPTLISEPLSDTTGAPVIDFIHLDVRVERSNGRPFGPSIAIDRSQAETHALLLDGEMTVMGGLFQTDVQVERVGVPILKDLPPWFFGLRYLFGFEKSTKTQRELIMVLQAHLRDPIPIRAERALPRDVQNDYRRQVHETIRRFNERVEEDFPFKPEENRSQNPNQ
jgi:type IV pilus assembly protein PilQ